MKSMSGFLIRIVTAAFAVVLAAGCSGGNASFTPHTPSPSANLVSIDVSPTNPSIALGTTKQFTATGIYSDHTSVDVTASVTWSSSSTTVSTITTTAGSFGLATAVAPGTTTIRASSGTISGSTTLTVRAASLLAIDLSPATARIALGTTKQFIATGIYSDNTTQDLTSLVSWNSTTGSVATISNATASRGLATAVAAGTTLISATSGTFTGNAALTVSGASMVSVNVSPVNPSVGQGTMKQFTATGVFSDSSTQDLTASVLWASSSAAVSTISNSAGSQGLATAAAAGTSVISASSGTFSGGTTLTVKPAALTLIAVTPAKPSLVLGATRQFIATGIYADNSTQDLTASVTWSSSDTTVAAVSNAAGAIGLATPVATGSTTVTATWGGVSGSTTLTVTAATLSSIAVAPTKPRIASGSTRQFTAIGIYSDGSTQDLTASATWTSSNPAAATVSNAAGSNGLASAVAAGATTITAASGIVSGNTTLTVTSATLFSIEVTPTNPGIALGSTRQFTATGIYSDDTRQDLTASVTWTSSNTTCAAISNAPGSNGLATSLAAGGTTISAALGGVSGSTSLTVTAATLSAINVTPVRPSLAPGTTRRFTAIGIYSDSSTQDLTESVAWRSSNTAAATISNAAGSNGIASASAAGSATITAALGAVSGSTTLTVTSAVLQSIEVAPLFPTVALGMPQQFTATGTYSDGTTQDLTASAVWSSSSTTVAVISNAPDSIGAMTPVGAGASTITAAFGGVTGSADLSVTAATLSSIIVTPAKQSIALGTTKQFTATGIYSDNTTKDITAFVTWGSSDTGVAAVSSAAGSAGLATSVGAGPATITAALGGVSGSTALTVTSETLVSIEVDPAVSSVSAGATRQFTAIGIYTDNSIQDLTASVTWTSSNTGVAVVSSAPGSNGLVTALFSGSATVAATAGGVSGSAGLTVTSAVLQAIDISPVIPSIAMDMQQQFFATGIYSDNTTADLTASVVWSSSSTTVAVISNAPGSVGLAMPLGAGTATISAAFSGVTGSTDLTVTAATLVSIDVTPLDPTIAATTSEQFSAFGNYSDGSVQDLTELVTWTSSNTAVATISNAAGSVGLAVPMAAGGTIITAWFDGVSGVSTLTVTSATLSSLVIAPTPTAQIARGTAVQFTATGNFSDGSTQDLTASVVWSSSNTAVASVSNQAGANGLATGVAGGSTNITAALGAVTSTATTLTVTTATLNTITVTPANTTIFLGASSQYTATGNFSDGTTQDLTMQVTWRSSNKNVASVGNTSRTKGLVTPVKAGTATISATLVSAGRTGSTGVTVSSATLLSITVTPINPTIAYAPKKTQQFTATGNYTTGSQDLTRSSNLTWSSSNTAVATIANKPTPKKGLATLVSTGTTTIKAQLKGSLSGTSLLTVN